MTSRARPARTFPPLCGPRPAESPSARTESAPADCIRGPTKPSKLAANYRPLVPVLRELILRSDTPLAPDVKDKIAAQLASAEDRFAAILR